jgi:mRNA-degrading endonuclease RelE of RelBE toxin-antitoxin system
MKPVIKQLQAGELLGDLIPNLSDSVYKIRVKNSDNNKGESAGYQIIYYVKRLEHITLLILHSESEQADISTAEIQAIIEKWHHEQGKD